MGIASVWDWWGRLPRWGLAILVAVAVMAAAGGASLLADFDGDGLNTLEERDAGTMGTVPDTDGDGVHDGLELELGTGPLVADSDADGLFDGREIELRSDPLSADTDGDGRPDAQEKDQDCDGDGVPAIASSDDDSDLLPDVMEVADCDPDVDEDGLLDGEEGNLLCVMRVDCDGDGVLDIDETTTDPLDPDTFDTGLPDSVALAFAAQGQPATSDADGDGIPDGWEDQTGLLDWGPFDPAPGRRDLLVEYLRVEGPHSGRFDLNFTPAYDAVAAMFAEGGVTVQWVETVITRDLEYRPDFLTESDLPHFRSILDNGTASTNPYVTSIILNPQQVQRHPGYVLGAAFLRNMVATVDYGAHTDFFFETQSGTELDPVRPVVESHIAAGDADLVRLLYGYDESGFLGNGEMFMRDLHHPAIGQGFTLHWFPSWFRSAPTYTADDGQSVTLVLDRVELATGELASTIAHELGHTLGLCHTHEAACQQALGVTAGQASGSTMSYNAPTGLLRFLPEEWEALRAHLKCPPQTTARLIAEGAGSAAVLSAKYDSAFTQQVQQRDCQDLTPLEREFDPVTTRTLYHPDVTELPPGRDGMALVQAYATATLLLAGIAAAGAVLSRR